MVLWCANMWWSSINESSEIQRLHWQHEYLWEKNCKLLACPAHFIYTIIHFCEAEIISDLIHKTSRRFSHAVNNSIELSATSTQISPFLHNLCKLAICKWGIRVKYHIFDLLVICFNLIYDMLTLKTYLVHYKWITRYS